MTIDARFITAVDLEEFFVDKTTGAPLSGGQIYFFEDENRNTPKAVYTISGGPPNYTYVALPNPLTLSAVGTPQDGAGNNVPIFYFPYEGVPADNSPDIELYYITVQNSAAVPQFTREAWPNLSASNNPQQQQANISNELSNPQFAAINFANENPYTIALVGANTFTIAIAPDWDLVVTTAGNSTVQVQRNAVAGSAQYPGNAPYTLTITPGLNIGVGGINLRQRFTGNPDIFSPANGGTNGWISASILIGPGSSASVSYQPNGQAPQQILNDNNLSGNFVQYSSTIQLAAAANPSTPDNGGYVDILVGLDNAVATTIGNVQIVGLDSDIANIDFEQTPINRQIDQLFNYYNQPLQYKPIPSYLVGWNFPYNPAQATGHAIGPFATGGVAGSFQSWDQTIVFQSVTNGVTIAQSASGSGALTVTAAATCQFALVQYLPATEAIQILNQPVSVNVAALTNQVGGVPATASLWYSTNAALPHTAVNNSIVATLNANGYPATRNDTATWFEITRNNLPSAQFTVGTSANSNANDYGFNLFNLNGAVNLTTVTWFAIVVGFGSLTIGNTVDIQSISLVPGNIPSRPGIQSADEVLRECQRYFFMTFDQGTVPRDNVGLSTGEHVWTATIAGNNNEYSPSLNFPCVMNSVPVITYWQPHAAGGGINNGNGWNTTQGTNITPTTSFVTPRTLSFSGTSGAGTTSGDYLHIHISADARLGL